MVMIRLPKLRLSCSTKLHSTWKYGSRSVAGQDRPLNMPGDSSGPLRRNQREGPPPVPGHRGACVRSPRGWVCASERTHTGRYLNSRLSLPRLTPSYNGPPCEALVSFRAVPTIASLCSASWRTPRVCSSSFPWPIILVLGQSHSSTGSSPCREPQVSALTILRASVNVSSSRGSKTIGITKREKHG
jgi:hypothetical protein